MTSAGYPSREVLHVLDTDAAARLAEDAAQALGPEGDLIGGLDMAGFGGSLLAVLNRAMEHPVQVGAASLRLGANMARIAQFAVARVAGMDAEPPIATGRDKRFADPAWTTTRLRRAAPVLPGRPAIL